jgi:hypothetical protein
MSSSAGSQPVSFPNRPVPDTPNNLPKTVHTMQIQDEIVPDTLILLPTDILGYLFTFLTVKTVECKIKRLNRKYKDLVDNPKICTFRRTLDMAYNPFIIAIQYSNPTNKNYINSKITDTIIVKMGYKYKNANIISLKHCINVTSEGLKKFFNGLKDLELRIILDGSYVCDTDILFLVKNKKNISSLDLLSCSRITSISMASIAMNCKTLKGLHISGEKIREVGLVLIFEQCTNLEKFTLFGNGITNETVIKISNCTKLKVVHLEECYNITDTGILEIANHCTDLTSLYLVGCDNITNEGIIPFIVNCPYLDIINH